MLWRFVFICLVLLPLHARASGTLFQYSTIDALLAGLYDGDITIDTLKEHGNFGLGTLNGLDGELLLTNGQAYHITAGGAAHIPAGSAQVPFAVVSFFDHGTHHTEVPEQSDIDTLNAFVLKKLPSPNKFYALKLDGQFTTVKTRAIPRQTKPYKPLAKAAKQQVVVEQTGRGTLVGYYSPAFVQAINVPGFHWHFLSADHKTGGHVLNVTVEKARLQIDMLDELTVKLPDNKAFNALDLTKDKQADLHAVEKDTK